MISISLTDFENPSHSHQHHHHIQNQPPKYIQSLRKLCLSNPKGDLLLEKGIKSNYFSICRRAHNDFPQAAAQYNTTITTRDEPALAPPSSSSSSFHCVPQQHKVITFSGKRIKSSPISPQWSTVSLGIRKIRLVVVKFS